MKLVEKNKQIEIYIENMKFVPQHIKIPRNSILIYQIRYDSENFFIQKKYGLGVYSSRGFWIEFEELNIIHYIKEDQPFKIKFDKIGIYHVNASNSSVQQVINVEEENMLASQATEDSYLIKQYSRLENLNIQSNFQILKSNEKQQKQYEKLVQSEGLQKLFDQQQKYSSNSLQIMESNEKTKFKINSFFEGVPEVEEKLCNNNQIIQKEVQLNSKLLQQINQYCYNFYNQENILKQVKISDFQKSKNINEVLVQKYKIFFQQRYQINEIFCNTINQLEIFK